MAILRLTEQSAKDLDLIVDLSIEIGLTDTLAQFKVIQRYGFSQENMDLLNILLLTYDPEGDIFSGVKNGYFISTISTAHFKETGGFGRIYREEQEKERKEKIDLANAQRLYNTYWYTFSFAVVALLISLVLLVLKLKE